MTNCCPRLIQHALLSFDDPPWSRLQIRKELAWGLLHYLDSVEPNAAIMEECPGLDGLQSRVHILDCRGVDGRMPRMGWMSGKTAGDARGWHRLGKVSNATGTGIHVWVLADSRIGKQTEESDV
jgi:hypothetical protein